MFRPLSHLRVVPQIRRLRCYTSSRILLAQEQRTAVRNGAGPDDAPILQYIQRKLQERNKLQSEVTEDPSLSEEDIQRFRKVKELEPLQNAWDEWIRTKRSLEETVPFLSDPDPTMRYLAQEEHAFLSETLSQLAETTFPQLVVPASSTTALSAIIELKAGVGGSEAALFLGELVRMYVRVASSLGWKASTVASSILDDGGMRDAVLEIKGKGAYDTLRWESGVHRVQRVPATEAKGRTHTSTVAVLVLPLTEESESSSTSDNDLFKMDEIKLEVMRARGAGGQHVNKTESAVRLTHLPTGITVSMQDERSQHQNRHRAFQVLRARLMDRKLNEEMIERRAVRRNLVKSADRSEKIRTYNYVQDRVTDHRLGLSVMNLPSVMEGGGLQEFLKALQARYHQDLLEDILSEQ